MIPAMQQRLNVAIVEDDAIFRSLVSAILSKETQFQVFEAASGAALDQILSETAIDCIVLDYNLGDDNAFAIKERVELQLQSAPPIIMLTGDGRESTVIRALRMGIEDYLPKRDLKAGTLISAITRVVTKDRDAKREKAEYLRLIQTSGIDPSTGLHSRSHLESRLARIVSLPLVNRASYALIAIEMNEFDDIVARFGLYVGDQSLRKFAGRLREMARNTDTFGRYSDNIFLVIAETGNDRALLGHLKGRLLDHLSFRLDVNLSSIQVSASIGSLQCHELKPDGVATATDLIEAAIVRLSPPGTEAELDAGSSIDAEKAVPLHDHQNAAPDLTSDLRSADRRSRLRTRVFKRGQIAVSSLSAVVDCTVRNQSGTGAALRVNTAFAPPPEFELTIAGDGRRRRVRLRWQVGTDFGVEYID
jgi:diguanylate cyclase (GGDEF)-like protein